MRVSVKKEGKLGDIPIPCTPARWLHIEDHSGYANDPDFEGTEAGKWFLEGIKKGTIPVQVAQRGDLPKEGYSHTLGSDSYSEVEHIMGFPLRGPFARKGHQVAHEYWSSPRYVLDPPDDPVEPPTDMRFTYENAKRFGYKEHRLGPDIGTSYGEQIVPNGLRDIYDSDSFHFSSNHAAILSGVLERLVGKESLLPPEKAKERTPFFGQGR